MHNIEEAIKKSYKPYDIVSDKNGSVGFIQEVSVNDGRSNPQDQLSYAVKWFYGNNIKHAWFYHEELEKHGNIFEEIALASLHPFGTGKKYTKIILGLTN
jgi:hypothetical protein